MSAEHYTTTVGPIELTGALPEDGLIVPGPVTCIHCTPRRFMHRHAAAL